MHASWITYNSLDFNASHDFADLGEQYEAAHNILPTRIGRAQARFLRQRPLIDWAVAWIEQHRK